MLYLTKRLRLARIVCSGTSTPVLATVGTESIPNSSNNGTMYLINCSYEDESVIEVRNKPKVPKPPKVLYQTKKDKWINPQLNYKGRR
jgi:hypothetical protein